MDFKAADNKIGNLAKLSRWAKPKKNGFIWNVEIFLEVECDEKKGMAFRHPFFHW